MEVQNLVSMMFGDLPLTAVFSSQQEGAILRLIESLNPTVKLSVEEAAKADLKIPGGLYPILILEYNYTFARDVSRFDLSRFLVAERQEHTYVSHRFYCTGNVLDELQKAVKNLYADREVARGNPPGHVQYVVDCLRGESFVMMFMADAPTPGLPGIA